MKEQEYRTLRKRKTRRQLEQGSRNRRMKLSQQALLTQNRQSHQQPELLQVFQIHQTMLWAEWLYQNHRRLVSEQPHRTHPRMMKLRRGL